MRQNHVKVFYAHCKGDSFVEAPESVITFVRAYGVNGVLVDCDWAELKFVPFGQIHLRRLSEQEREARPPYMTLPYERFLATLTVDDWLEETTDEVVVLPVSTLELVEQREGGYADYQP